ELGNAGQRARKLSDRRSVVTAMDALERAARIAELQRQVDAGRRRIAERQAAREQDPCAMQDHLLADFRLTQEPGDLAYTEPVEPVGSSAERNGAARGIIYKDHHGGALQPAPEPEPHASDEMDERTARAVGCVIAIVRRE